MGSGRTPVTGHDACMFLGDGLREGKLLAVLLGHPCLCGGGRQQGTFNQTCQVLYRVRGVRGVIGVRDDLSRLVRESPTVRR